MYLMDFFNRLTRKSNAPLVVYLILNVFIIKFVVCKLFLFSDWQGYALSILLYCFSLAIALSPVGEWFLRLQTGCKEIQREDQREYIYPIFKEVYDKAKKQDPSIPDDVQLYINNSSAPNAFATGRKTICITEGLLHIPEKQIKATLGHEFGHLAHKDTDMILLVSVGNLIVNLIILGIRVLIGCIYIFFSILAIFASIIDHGLSAELGRFSYWMLTAGISGLIWIWTKVGTILVMKSSRSNEYEADSFSYELGYGNELCAMLDTVAVSNEKGLFANLASTHPDKQDRISRLQKLGATYRNQYNDEKNVSF